LSAFFHFLHDNAQHGRDGVFLIEAISWGFLSLVPIQYYCYRAGRFRTSRLPALFSAWEPKSSDATRRQQKGNSIVLHASRYNMSFPPLTPFRYFLAEDTKVLSWRAGR
jgi:hypothetical protein